MSCCWMQVWTPHPSSRGFVNIGTDVSAQVVLTPSQPGERFYCDVETHPSSRSRRNKRGRMLYRVCSLNFHRLSRLQSHPVATGCIFRGSMQSVICHFRVLMKSVKREESCFQTAGRCNLVWFSFKDVAATSWVVGQLTRTTAFLRIGFFCCCCCFCCFF